MKSIIIGSGAGYGGDRIEPAIDLIESGNLDYIGFECLAERTISLAVQQKKMDPEKGYNEFLESRFEKILPAMVGKKVKVITNMGAANPEGAAKRVVEMIRRMNLKGFKVAAVTGDDMLANLDKYQNLITMETGKPLSEVQGTVLSANAYCGVGGIVEALELGANIVITGRGSDPSLFLGPVIHEFGWKTDNWPLLGQGTVLGHLLECSAQVTGGYYADPGYKDVPDLWNIGFPMATVYEDGSFEISKLEKSGGLVTTSTVKEQLLYEILDPKSYLTPDVVADFSTVRLEQIGKDRVRVYGGTGTKKTGLVKVSVGFDDGYIGEGEISYGGPGALERAQLAGTVIEKRIEQLKLPVEETRIDLIGVDSLFKTNLSQRLADQDRKYHDVRLRVATRSKDIETARQIGNEVEALYLNGPCGGGGARKYVRDVVSIVSVLIPEDNIKFNVEILEV